MGIGNYWEYLTQPVRYMRDLRIVLAAEKTAAAFSDHQGR